MSNWYETEQGEFVHSRKALPEDVELVMGNDGERSEFCWITLPNGDLVLGVYPEGDTYEKLTQERRV